MVYLIVNDHAQTCKIGISNKPEKRLATLQTGNSHPLRLAYVLPGSEAIERQLHENFRAERLSGEWFNHTEAIDLQFNMLKKIEMLPDHLVDVVGGVMGDLNAGIIGPDDVPRVMSERRNKANAIQWAYNHPC